MRGKKAKKIKKEMLKLMPNLAIYSAKQFKNIYRNEKKVERKSIIAI
jgi:hypothetical protein